jgi:hypothetical protein
MTEIYREKILNYCPKCYIEEETFKSRRGGHLPSMSNFKTHIGKCNPLVNAKMKNLMNLTKVGCQIINFLSTYFLTAVWKIFFFHLLSNFIEILWKFSANHVQNFQFAGFWILNKKSGRITYFTVLYLLQIRMSTNELVARFSFLNYRWNF